MSESKPSKRKVFSSRLLSTLLLWGVMFLAFWLANDWLFLGLILIAVFMGLREYFSLYQDKGFQQFQWITIGVGLLYFVLLFGVHAGWNIPAAEQLDGLALFALFVGIFGIRLRKPLDGEQSLHEIAAAVFGFVYLVILFSFVPKLLFLPLQSAPDPANAGSTQPTAHFYLLYLVAVTKFTDMGAYAIGSLIGKHKMIPHISPGKTWQGFGGAILFALIASFGCLFLMGNQIPLITPLHATILAVVIALLAVTGDLCESVIKRTLEVKDSGKVMPGIGGIMDLVDSPIFTGPFFYLYVSYLLK